MAQITVQDVLEAGVVGAGGAGFPTHVKLAGKADSVVINAAECEPLLHKDKEVLRAYADDVLEGLSTGMRLVGAQRGYVGVKEKYKDVIELLQAKVPQNIEVAPLRDAYPAGDEFILVYDVLGRVIPPGGIPLAVGAVVMNVETAMNVARLRKRIRSPRSIFPSPGRWPNPVTLRVPLGVTLAQCVAAAGGPTISGRQLHCWRRDDGLSGNEPRRTGRQDDRRRDRAARTTMWSFAVDSGIGRKSPGSAAAHATSAVSARNLCPRWLLGHPIEPHRAMRSLEFNLVGEANVLGTQFCCECNLCSMYSCPEDLDPKNVCSQNKRRLASEKRRWENPPFNPKRPELHMANRKAPTARLLTKLGLRQFRNVGPLNDTLMPAQRVGIKLKQHLGAPCEASVTVGQSVRKGQVIARPPMANGKPALGAPIHASIDGTVVSIENGVVWINAN